MIIDNLLIGLIVAGVYTIISVMIWRHIAEYIGRKLGIGKFVVRMFSKRKQNAELDTLNNHNSMNSLQSDLVFKNISNSNLDIAMSLKVKENQTKYVSSVEKSLAQAYLNKDHVFPFLIYKNEIATGFIMIRFNPEYDNHFIWQFFIDDKYQNMGYGKLSITKAIDWIINQNNSLNIVTTVIDENSYASLMYEKLGFKKIEGTSNGEIDYILNIEDYLNQ